jgi:hypothetical protein
MTGYRHIAVDSMIGFLSRNGDGGDALYQELQQAWRRRFCREI